MSEKTMILLVEPENSDNIGATARAMKNMGMTELRLVKPPRGWRRRSQKMAVSAKDVIQKATSYPSVPKAIQDAHLVIGTTRRGGPKRGTFMPFGQAIRTMDRHEKRAKNKTIIMFGRESKGLDNESLAECDWVTTIPVSSNYPSINLAQAVILVAYSLFIYQNTNADIREFRRTAIVPKRGIKGRGQEILREERNMGWTTKKEQQEVLCAMVLGLEVLGYGRKGHDLLHRIRTTLHGLFKRNGLLASEAQMFKGLSRQIREKVKR